MRKAITVLAVVSAMLLALTAVASAESWQIHPNSVAFTTSSGELKLTSAAGDQIVCTSSTGEGQYVSSTTAEGIKLKFHGCKDGVNGISCHNGSTTGTVETTNLVAHNVWANKHGVKTRAILLTPDTGKHFATFKCTIFGIGPTITLTGSIIGEVELTKPCNQLATEAHLNFESEKAGHQTLRALWNTAGAYDLTADKEGAPWTASRDVTFTIKFAENPTITC